MNLDELKETWNEETIEQVPEVSLSEQKELKSPLAVIRKNMKKEFWTNNILIALIILCCILGIENKRLLTYVMSLVAIGVLVVGYYSLKFREFYREIEKPNYSTFQSLLELNYKMKYYTDLYVSYYIASVPIIFCELLLFYQFGDKFRNFQIWTFVLSLIISFIFVYFFGKWWFNNYYGKHIAKISNLLHEVKHPYKDFDKKIIKVDEKKYWFNKTEDFFTKKLGWFGKVINWIVWILLSIVVLFIVGFIVGFTFGYVSAMLSN
ncbi:MAG: hypothetical protein KGV44_06265 [Flavobacteriaceae bacterium]|nr:hypothetical protein [Flavobacteriaceae bacterium]